MTNIIEKVAAALCEANLGDDPYAACTLAGAENSKGWEQWVDEARAAIEAMREPTEKMEAAADDLNPGSNLPYEPGSPKKVWQAMIDHMLAEREREG